MRTNPVSLLALALAACATTSATTSVPFAAELQACVAESSTREQADECRAEVEARHSRDPGYTLAADAGGDR